MTIDEYYEQDFDFESDKPYSSMKVKLGLFATYYNTLS
jgi:hypothetical protein